MPVFGFKAKRLDGVSRDGSIVPCLCLDSRQNTSSVSVPNVEIVPCLCLDSRQNNIEAYLSDIALYHACVWIQGKTASARSGEATPLYHACVWIQGKTMQDLTDMRNALYHACVWIQGKTPATLRLTLTNCTMPVFGFKAKLRRILAC